MVLGDIGLVKTVDAGSPKIFEALASGRLLRTATISFTKNFQGIPFEYLRFDLEDCTISKAAYGAAEESLAIAWTRLRMSYRSQRPDGTAATPVVVTWDRRAGRPF